MKKKYRINYTVCILTPDGFRELADKEIIVSNRDNDLMAKVSLEDYLRRKHGAGFVSLTVLSCREESENPLEDFLKGFGMFK